jgi:transcriptional regulator with XRE-family HTH domain
MKRKAGRNPFPSGSRTRREGLGRAIQAQRAERGLKRQALADSAGLSYAYLAEIENGKKEPSTRVLDGIARALGIRLPELMEMTESLQEMLERADESTSKPGGESSFEAARAVSYPRSLADRPWFHRSIEPPTQRARTGESLETAARKPTDAQSRTEMLEELQALVSRLPPQDLERMLDLARRLSQ